MYCPERTVKAALRILEDYPPISSVTWVAPSPAGVVLEGQFVSYPLNINTDGLQGTTLFWRLNPSSDADILLYCAVTATSVVSADGSATNILTNSSNLGTNLLYGSIDVSDVSDFSSNVYTSATITTGTP